MKKEISFELKNTYEGDFLDNGLKLPRGFKTVPGGSILKFDGYEELEILLSDIKAAYLDTPYQVGKSNIYKLYQLLEEEKAYQNTVLASIHSYAQNFINNVNSIEGIHDADRINILNQGIATATQSNGYKNLDAGLKGLISPHHIFLEDRDLTFAGFAKNESLYYHKIVEALTAKLNFLKTQLKSFEE
ncbi:hypothetical protein [Pedobacter psychrodurus]|uniref:hypothetical protein n=1 Tax=Pedobacter psychrodurus TaxID=2530456 RepID=UPI00292F4FB4|nr:hypothetical protein [Pedobacter psychrodurus]